MLILFTDYLCRFHPVHLRHLNVQKDHIKYRAIGLDDFDPILKFRDLYSKIVFFHESSEEALQLVTAGFFILNDSDMQLKWIHGFHLSL